MHRIPRKSVSIPAVMGGLAIAQRDEEPAEEDKVFFYIWLTESSLTIKLIKEIF